MNLRARRQEQGYTEPEETSGDWVSWPSIVRKVGVWFCGLILFSFVAGILGLNPRTGVFIGGVTLGAVYLAMRMRRRSK